MLCRATMGRLLQNAGNGASLTYQFLPGNHEVGSRHTLALFPSHLWIGKAYDKNNNNNIQKCISCCDDGCIDHLCQFHGRFVRPD